MLRATFSALVAVLFVVAIGLADDVKDGRDAKGKKNEVKATITKVDPANGTITVRMKDKNGKEVEKTYALTGDIEYFDSTAKAAKIDIFRAGDEILVVAAKGKLKSVQMDRDKKKEPR
jgi:hypothetical protein